jgi:hypothetical protein
VPSRLEGVLEGNMSGDASQTVAGCSMDVGEWAADETSARSMKGAVADG